MPLDIIKPIAQYCWAMDPIDILLVPLALTGAMFFLWFIIGTIKETGEMLKKRTPEGLLGALVCISLLGLIL